MTRRRTIQRSGMSLIEMLMVMGVMTMVTGAACALLISALRINNGTTKLRLRMSAIQQLQERLQRDAHAASGARLIAGEVSEQDLELAWTDKNRVIFRSVSGGIERREMDAAGQLLRRETYRLYLPAKARWQIAESKPVRVTLQLVDVDERQPLSAVWRAWSTVAVIGGNSDLVTGVEK